MIANAMGKISGRNESEPASDLVNLRCYRRRYRKKYVEAIKAARFQNKKGKPDKPSKADVALSKINKLYALERQFKELDDEHRRLTRGSHSLHKLTELKDWAEKNISHVPKDSLTHKARSHTFNQWDTLTDYCEDVLQHIAAADTLAELEALLPWNTVLVAEDKKG